MLWISRLGESLPLRFRGHCRGETVIACSRRRSELPNLSSNDEESIGRLDSALLHKGKLSICPTR